MEIKLKKYQDIHLFLMEGELDLYNASKLENVFQSLLNKGVTSFILDLKNISYIDSSGIGILLKLFSLANARRLGFALSRVDGEVPNVLRLTNLIHYFPIEPDFRAAVKTVCRYKK